MKKTFKGFTSVIIYMTVGVVIGAISYLLFNSTLFNRERLLFCIQEFLVQELPLLFYGIAGLSIVLTILFYHLGKKELFNSTTDDAEDAVVTSSKWMALAMTLPKLGLFILLSLFSALLIYIDRVQSRDIATTVAILLTLSGFCFFVVIAQKIMVDKIKEFQPEKKGNVYHLSFSKEWEGSLDEREKLILYRIGYRSQSVFNVILLILLVVSSFLSDQASNPFGVLPSLIFGGLLVVSLLLNCYYSIKEDSIIH